MSSFVDANVLLELLLPERPKPDIAAAALAQNTDSKISPLTAHLFVHFGQKAKLPLEVMLKQIKTYNFTGMGSAEISWAITNCPDNDFEDALQVACALLDGCDKFITFDAGLAKNYGRFINIELLA